MNTKQTGNVPPVVRSGTVYSAEWPALSGEVFVGRWVEGEEFKKTPSSEVSFVGQADEASLEGVSSGDGWSRTGQVLAKPQPVGVPALTVPEPSQPSLAGVEVERSTQKPAERLPSWPAAAKKREVQTEGKRFEAEETENLSKELQPARIEPPVWPKKRKPAQLSQSEELASRQAGAKRQRLTGRLARGVGIGLLLVSLLGLGLMFTPLIIAEVRYRAGQVLNSQGSASAGSKTGQGRFGALLAREISGPDYSQVVPDADFSVIVPKIKASSRVISNVDPGDERAYTKALKQGVAHAAGTVFPGMVGNIFLFAHSTDSPLNIAKYNAQFFLLRELELGDEIQVYYLGKKYNYTVYDKQIQPADDVRYLQPQEKEERLVLQTCWPPGTSWKRLVVLARPAAI